MTLFVEDMKIGRDGACPGWSNIKQNAFLPFIMKEQGFKAIK